MKCLEKLTADMLKTEVAAKFAYKQGKSTEDVVISVTHLVRRHLEDIKDYASVLFIYFSFAFNIFHRNLLAPKLADMKVNPQIILSS